MYVQKNLITDVNGNVLLTVVEDNTEVAREIHRKKETTKGWTPDRTMKMAVSIPPYVYQKYVDLYGPECWQSNDFLKFFKAHRPEFCI